MSYPRVFLALLAAISNPTVAACLLGDYSVRAEFARSAVVFIGTPTAEGILLDSEDQQDLAAIIYTVEVSRTYKGRRKERIELYSENSSGRFPMELGQQYVLFIYREGNHASVDPCGNSGLVSQRAKVLVTLRGSAGRQRFGPLE